MWRAKRSWGFERLESRRLLTGTVFIGRSGDTSATINGDNADDAIVIHQIGNLNGSAQLKIVGLNGTKIVNAYSESEPVYKVPKTSSAIFAASSLEIDLHGGNDLLVIQDTTLPGTLAINMGAGNDTLRMNSVNFAPAVFSGAFPGDQSAIQLGGGNDVAVIDTISSRGDLAISAGLGRDVVKMYQCIAAQSQISVDMGHGDSDLLQVYDSKADSAVFTAEGTHAKVDSSWGDFQHVTELGFKVKSNNGPFSEVG